MSIARSKPGSIPPGPPDRGPVVEFSYPIPPTPRLHSGVKILWAG